MNHPTTNKTQRANRSVRWCVVALLALAGVPGCASKPGVIFDSAEGGPAAEWPPAPDSPRIRYVGQLRSADDLAPARSGLEGLGEAIFGKAPVQGMVSPLAVCTDGVAGVGGTSGTGGQRVFIADSGGQCVQVLDLQSRKYERWAPKDQGSRFLQPVAVAFDPGAGVGAGRLLVADSQAAQIVALDEEGRPVGVLGRGLLRRPCGLAIDHQTHRIYVADAGAHQVVILNPDGSEAGRLGERGGGPGQFNYPTNVALDRSGRLYVSDSLNFRVQVFGPDGRPERVIGRKGDMPGYFAQPKGIALDSEDHLYVVDANFEAVQLFDTDGQLLMTFGREGHGPGEFWLPSGLWIDANNRVWIADVYNRRVQVFDYLPEVKRP